MRLAIAVGASVGGLRSDGSLPAQRGPMPLAWSTLTSDRRDVKHADSDLGGKLGLGRSPLRSGLAAVEFVVVLPVLLTIVLGCVDFGRFAYTHVAITNAARAGAAYAIMHSYLPADQTAWTVEVQQAARAEMIHQTGYVPADLTVQVKPFTDANGLRRVQIIASYPFRMIVPWPGIPSSVTLQTMIQMGAIR
jgi:hypothetical protein